MKALQVARKFLREIAREPGVLALIVLIPLAFLGLAAFAYSTPYQVTLPLWVTVGEGGDLGLVESLAAEEYPDGLPVFEVQKIDDALEADKALRAREITVFLSVDVDGDGDLVVAVYGDALYGPFYRASVILDEIIFRHADRVVKRQTPLQINEARYAPFGPLNEFDFYAPGMIVFALLMLVPQTAMLVGRELRWGTLRRLRLSRVRSWELLLGISLAEIVTAIAMVLIIFFVALALGYHNNGSLGLAMAVSLAISISAIGLGLLVGCFIENDSQAVNLGSTVSMLGIFLAGAFFPMPSMTLFTLAGHPIALFDFFPATHGLLALQQVLNNGAGFAQIGFRFGATLLLSVVYFTLGVVFFQRNKMRGESLPIQ